MKYIIQVATSGKHFHISIKRQSGGGKKSKKVELQAAFILQNGVYQLNNDQEMFVRTTNELWNIDNIESVARGLLNFFLDSKSASSNNWTSFWHIKRFGENTKIYKMYDCNLKFLMTNVKLYSIEKSN